MTAGTSRTGTSPTDTPPTGAKKEVLDAGHSHATVKTTTVKTSQSGTSTIASCMKSLSSEGEDGKTAVFRGVCDWRDCFNSLTGPFRAIIRNVGVLFSLPFRVIHLLFDTVKGVCFGKTEANKGNTPKEEGEKVDKVEREKVDKVEGEKTEDAREGGPKPKETTDKEE